uniref:Uncharacterized protein n=1 Tax=Sinocyclocheilus grahami TaxID=75366 RepID=A0A672N364_SINGR
NDGSGFGKLIFGSGTKLPDNQNK